MIQRMFLRRGIGIRTVLSCGGTHLPQVMGDYFEEDVRFRYIGHTLTTADVMSRHSAIPIDLVLHTDPKPESGDTSALIEYCRSHQIGYAFLPPVFADVPHLLSISYAGLTPMLRFEPTPLDGWGRVWKRASDLILGALLLILLSPVLILVAALILVTCGWPIFYISKRTGQYGKQMVPLLKFRTMCRDADLQKPELVHMSHRGDGPLFKIKNDPRITPIGRFLRRWSIDELPQLLNVVAGHLSLVGPRPHLPNEVARYSQSQHRVFTVRPGVTGLAQISGRSDLSFEEEVQLDMRYIEDWSLALDLWIIWRTVAVVLSGKGAD
jgi:lipopolysaccharide/colanic/teichoic acid biosynthesis glycosyltransferase